MSTEPTQHTTTRHPIHTNEYVDHAGISKTRSSSSSITATTTLLLPHSLSSHSFEQDIPSSTNSPNPTPRCLSNNNNNSPLSTIRNLEDTLPNISLFDDDDLDDQPSHNSTILVDSDSISNNNNINNNSNKKVDLNISDFSLAPVRLMNTFDDTYTKTSSDQQQQPQDSPTDVKSFHNEPPTTNKPTNNNTDSNNKLTLPPFKLTDFLKLSLPQPTIDRISFYGVVFATNHQLTLRANTTTTTTKQPPQPTQITEPSPLLHAVLGPTPPPNPPPGHSHSALIDEEEFILALIRARPIEEALDPCPISFAEAIGEVAEGCSGGGSEGILGGGGQTANPLNVLSVSRTQLWKPSRSWWEAKSGKNPWIEPKSHNKRWRYLWPIIHYHKFLAKCIKKLKRNSVDVKTCLSPVSTFLRSEVCAVSNHLASSSRFTSEEWMEGLPQFHGWIPDDTEQRDVIRELVRCLPIRSLGEAVDWESPLVRGGIEECFEVAIEVDREQMVVDCLEGEDGEGIVGGYGRDRGSNGGVPTGVTAVNGESVVYARPPKARPPKKTPGSATKQRRKKKSVDMSMGGRYPSTAMNGGWNRAGQQMMPAHSMPHGMYPPQYNNQYTVPPPPSNNYPAENGYTYGNPTPSMYGGSDEYTHHHPQAEWGQHPMNGNMHYHNQWEQPQPMGNDVQYFQQANGQIPSWTTHEEPPVPQPHYTEQPIPHTYIPTTESQTLPSEPIEPTHIEPPRREYLMTPSKTRYGTNGSEPQTTIPPDSPYWAHLGFSTLAMSGLATPQGSGQRAAASPLIAVEGGDGFSGRRMSGRRRGGLSGVQTSKPLLLNAPYSYHHQGNAMNIPPSPATQFLMSPQTNSRTTAFFAQTINPTFQPASPHHASPHHASPHQHHHHPAQHHSIQHHAPHSQLAVQEHTRMPDTPPREGDTAKALEFRVEEEEEEAICEEEEEGEE